jgi:molybdate transport repressor ModE-like protein
MLHLRRIEILCAVARTGSLAAAARELSYSTPAVWQHMRRLEAEVGHPLLTTHARGVALTPAGRILARHGERLQRRVRLAEDELAALNRLEAGELRVAAFATAGAGLLPEPIARFRSAHPAVGLSLAEHDPADALHLLRHGEIDLAVVFTFDPTPPDLDGLAFTHLLDDPLHVVTPADHPLADGEVITLEQLRTESWLQGSYTPATQDDGVPGTRLAYRGGDFNTVQRLVAAGAGVALIPRLALAPISADTAVRPLAGEPRSRHVFAATLQPLSATAATRRFLELLLDAAQTLEASWQTAT